MIIAILLIHARDNRVLHSFKIIIIVYNLFTCYFCLNLKLNTLKTSNTIKIKNQDEIFQYEKNGIQIYPCNVSNYFFHN